MRACLFALPLGAKTGFDGSISSCFLLKLTRGDLASWAAELGCPKLFMVLPIWTG